MVVAGCTCGWWLWVCYSSVLLFVYDGGFLFCIFLNIILMYKIEK